MRPLFKSLIQIETRIAELQNIREGLSQLVSCCPGHGSASACPILAALTGTRID